MTSEAIREVETCVYAPYVTGFIAAVYVSLLADDVDELILMDYAHELQKRGINTELLSLGKVSMESLQPWWESQLALQYPKHKQH